MVVVVVLVVLSPGMGEGRDGGRMEALSRTNGLG